MSVAAPPVRAVRQDALRDLALMPAVSRWVETSRLRLHVLDYGVDADPDNGRGADLPVAVFLPGITTPAACFDFVAREVSGLVRAMVLDLRGRGLSDSADTFDLADYAADLLAVVDDLGGPAPIVVGHSLGARIAAYAAVEAAALGRPFGATIVVDPPLSGPDRGPYPTTLATFLGQYDDAAAGTTPDAVAASWPSWPRREQELRARWLSSCQREAIVATHENFEREDFFDTWHAVPGPTAFVHGARSPVVTPEGLAEVRSVRPDVPCRVVPDAGHMVFWDNPQASLSILTELLGALPG